MRFFCVFFLMLSPAVAGADERKACAERGEIISRLSADFGEVGQARGLDNDTKLVEIWASSQTGSWTMLVTDPDGQTCVAAAGEYWQAANPSKVIGS